MVMKMQSISIELFIYFSWQLVLVLANIKYLHNEIDNNLWNMNWIHISCFKLFLLLIWCSTIPFERFCLFLNLNSTVLNEQTNLNIDSTLNKQCGVIVQRNQRVRPFYKIWLLTKWFLKYWGEMLPYHPYYIRHWA